MQRRWLATTVARAGLACVLAATAARPARTQSNGPLSQMRLPTIDRSAEVRAVLPSWVAMPATARILTSDGLVLRPIRNSAVTHENARLGILVGALGNAGGCARNLRVTLQYTDDHWRPMGEPIENEARVSEVAPGGMVPYRFRLKRNDDFAEPPSGYILQVAEDGKRVANRLEWVETQPRREPVPCPPAPVVMRALVGRSRATLSGYRVSGTITLDAGGPIRPDAVTITALLRDGQGEVLEVLTGVPVVDARTLPSGVIENGQVLPFTMSTDMPLGKSVANTTLFTEVLPDARVASPLP